MKYNKKLLKIAFIISQKKVKLADNMAQFERNIDIGEGIFPNWGGGLFANIRLLIYE